MSKNEKIVPIIESLDQLSEDNTVPRNIRRGATSAKESLLKEEDAVGKDSPGVKELGQKRRRNRVGKVPGGPEGGDLVIAPQPVEVERQDVRLDDLDVGRDGLPESGDEPGVLLDGDDPGRPLRQQDGQGALPGPDLETHITRTGANGPGDPEQHGPAGQEVLAEGVTARFFHQGHHSPFPGPVNPAQNLPAEVIKLLT